MSLLQIAFITANSDISPALKDHIQTTLQKHSGEALNVLGITKRVTISVYPNPSWTLPETGVGGYTPSGDWIQISLDPARENDVMSNLPATLYHECNHIARWQSVGYGNSLLERMVSEGLACVFEKLYAKSAMAWTTYTETEIDVMMNIIRTLQPHADEAVDHARWFFGTDTMIPRWLGYKFGTYIVERALQNHADRSIVELTRCPAEQILEWSGIKQVFNA